MADPEQLEILLSGVPQWNRWRRSHKGVRPDLTGDLPVDGFEADLLAIVEAVVHEVVPGRAPVDEGDHGPLSGASLVGADLRDADLSGARLDGAMLAEARLDRAVLDHADLAGAVLTGARLPRATALGANLTAASLRWAVLDRADLTGANLRLASADGVSARRTVLREADLFYASLVQADLRGADLTGALVYGASAWDVRLEGTIQERLVITRVDEPTVVVDDLEVAQFLHLVMTNSRIRGVIDTLTTSVVLLLGRFTPARKAVLDAVSQALRGRGLVPVLFDFERPASRDFTETVTTLAHLSRFIVADLTDPASLPKELEAIVPHLAVPVVPIIQEGHEPYAMFADYWKYDWVLDLVRYRSVKSLLDGLDGLVVAPANAAATELAARRARATRAR